jgi:hypothetical protein
MNRRKVERAARQCVGLVSPQALNNVDFSCDDSRLSADDASALDPPTA